MASSMELDFTKMSSQTFIFGSYASDTRTVIDFLNIVVNETGDTKRLLERYKMERNFLGRLFGEGYLEEEPSRAVVSVLENPQIKITVTRTYVNKSSKEVQEDIIRATKADIDFAGNVFSTKSALEDEIGKKVTKHIDIRKKLFDSENSYKKVDPETLDPMDFEDYLITQADYIMCGRNFEPDIAEANLKYLIDQDDDFSPVIARILDLAKHPPKEYEELLSLEARKAACIRIGTGDFLRYAGRLEERIQRYLDPE